METGSDFGSEPTAGELRMNFEHAHVSGHFEHRGVIPSYLSRRILMRSRRRLGVPCSKACGAEVAMDGHADADPVRPSAARLRPARQPTFKGCRPADNG